MGKLSAVALVAWAVAPAASAAVTRCVLEGTVDAGSAAYLEDCVELAERRGDAALLVRLDTPGGSLESTRQIARAFLGAEVPVLIWVGPSGARAGSAGLFLVLASHFAAMAPGTNIGAAHPVMGPAGVDPEEAGDAAAEKAVNDAVAFAQALAHQRGRNADWAEEAVRESASAPAERAVELRIADAIAASEEELLSRADGRTVELASGEHTLATRGALLLELRPTWRQRVIHWLANPAVAYLLFLLGGLGIALELSHPGLVAPGVIGVVSLVLAMVAFSALPVQAGAIVLLVIGVGLVVAELLLPSGLLGAGGAVLLVLGGVLLVDRFDPRWFVEPSFRMSWRLALPSAAAVAAAAAYVARRAGQARRLPQRAADLGLVGDVGKVLEPVGRERGEVFVHGERWHAVSDQPIAAGRSVVVRRVEGLTLGVEEVGR
ncbi:MAG: nodulation protein NfeD [Myxococcales bacterium]|nr:nodulation protein NfeD [Myxococcales bacterium]